MKGQREANKEDLAKYLEYATDMPMDKIIPKHLRNLDKFTKFAVKKACKERMQGLLLPADFSLSGDHGIYVVYDQRQRDGQIYISLRHDTGLGAMPLGERMEGELELEDNWSKMGATLREMNGDKMVQLSQLFLFKIKEEPKEEEEEEEEEEDGNKDHGDLAQCESGHEAKYMGDMHEEVNTETATSMESAASGLVEGMATPKPKRFCRSGSTRSVGNEPDEKKKLGCASHALPLVAPQASSMPASKKQKLHAFFGK